MKTLIRIGLAAWLLASSLAHAQSQSGPAPDIGAGKKRAAACFACHNADGISKIPGTPHLAGQDRSYLESALRAYRDGQTRQNPTMNAMAKPLSDRDIVNIAAYYSLQTRMNNGQTAAQAMETIERIRPVGVAGAPKLGDQVAWSPRIGQGGATLVQHALQGFKGMPAKGGCSNCSDAEVKAAVEYLTAKAK